MANAGTLEIQLLANVARLQEDMDASKKAVGSAMAHIENTVAKARGALVGLAAGLTVGAFAGMIRGSIDAADEMSKLGQKAGVATEDVAGLQLAFRQAGAGQALEQSMAKLSKSIESGSKGFDAMGIATRGADGQLKSTRSVLGEVADKFAGYADGAAKSALAQEIFGKSGAELIPLLNAGGAALDEYDAMALKLGLTLSDETVKQAEKFNDTVDLMGQASQGVSRQIAAQLLPTLSGLAEQFFSSMTEGDKLKRTADFLASGLKGLYVVALGTVEVFSTVGTVLGGVGAAVVAALSGDFSAASTILGAMRSDLGDNWQATLQDMQKAWTATGSSSFEAMATTQKALQKAAPGVSGFGDKAKAAASEADKLIKAGAELAAGLIAQEGGLAADFAKKWDSLGVAYQAGAVSLEHLLQAQAKLLDQQPAMKALADAKAKDADATQKQAMAYADAAAAASAYLGTVARQNAREIGGMGKGAKYRTAQAGVGAIEDKQTTKRQELEGDLRRGKIDRTEFDAYLAIVDDTYAQEVAAYSRRTIDIEAQQGDWLLGATEGLHNYLDTSADVYSQISALVSKSFKGAEDALVNFVKTGKLDFASLADSIISDLIRIAVQRSITGPLASAMFGGLGGGAASGGFFADLLSFDGGGSTGSGARSGGLDGKGGFVAMLHPQESVIDHTKGQSAVAPTSTTLVVNVIESPGNGGQQARRTENGVDMLDIFVEKVKSSLASDIALGNGSVPNALSSTYGLNRVAGAY